MKKMLIATIMSAALLSGVSLRADEMKMDHNKGYCAKHCNVMQLTKDVKALEKEIAADKASAQNAGGAEKLATANAKKEQMKKHIDNHIRELADLKAELERSETELNQMGTK